MADFPITQTGIELQAILDNAITLQGSEVSPLGNKNVFMRSGAVPGADTFPTVATSYTAGQEPLFGLFAGVGGVTDLLVNDAAGLRWEALSIELRYTIEDTSKFLEGDETVYIVDNNGVSRWLKVASIGALSSTLVGNLLTVTIDFAIFAELSIASMHKLGLQDVAGVFGEKNAQGVINSIMPELLRARKITQYSSSRVDGVVYTNTGITPMVISIYGFGDGGDAGLFVDEGPDRVSITPAGSANFNSVNYEVQSGQTYRLDKGASATFTVTSWTEEVF